MIASRSRAAAASPAPSAVPEPSAGGPDVGGSRSLRVFGTAAGACLAVLVLALVLAGGRPQPAVAGLPDAGPLTGWALPVVRLLFDLAAVTTVGALLTAVVLLRPTSGGLPSSGGAAVRCAGWSAGLWSVSSLLLLLLTVSETRGLPLDRLVLPDLAAAAGDGRGRALVVVAVLSVAVAAGCSRRPSVPGAQWLLLLAGLGLLPTTLTGHAASAADHELAISSLVVHVVAATVWVGGLLGVLLFLRRSGELAQAVPRFSVVALCCFTLVGLSGLLSAYERLGASPAAWTSGYGAVLLAKTVALVVLGAMGWQHRRRLVPGLVAGRPGAFLSFAGAELAVMGGAFGLAVALSRTPTPATGSPGPTAVASHGAGHETLPTTLEPVSMSGLVLEWRVNAVVLAVAGLLAVAYLAGARRASSEGAPWPRRRTVAFLAALVLGVLALCSGIATYAAAMISVQVAQFLLLLLVVPGLLVLGAPLTLRSHVRGLDGSAHVPAALSAPVVRALTDPLTSMALTAGLLFLVYRTGLLDRALGSSGLFLLVNTAALAVGWLLMWTSLGTDALPGRRTGFERVLPLLTTAASLLVLALELRSTDSLLAGRWFAELGWTWVDPAADQRLAALFVTVAVVLLLAVAAAAGRPPAAAPYPETTSGRRRR